MGFGGGRCGAHRIAAATVADPYALLKSHFRDQGLARRRQRLEGLRAAAGVGMRGFGGALPGAVDFRRGQAAVERQAQQLPMLLFRRQRLQRDIAPAEFWRGERMQDRANDAEAASRGLGDDGVGRCRRGVAQDRQRLRGRLPQQHLGGGPRHHVGETRGFAPVRRGRLPDPLDFELPFA